MPNKIRNWAIIPAAGSSERIGTLVPKQYLPLDNTTVIEAAISNFLQHPKITGVIVALHPDDQHWGHLAITRNEKIHSVIGGESRAESVQNAINYLENTPAEDQDFVLVHDAARPCLRYTDLELLIEQLEQDDVGGILASPVSDTLKVVDNQNGSMNTVNKTLDRENVWRALTPQMFRLATLKKALMHCVKHNIKVTDDASAVEHLGLKIKLVKGHGDNIKITHTEDLELAAAILKKIN